jgi:hypothetical protein
VLALAGRGCGGMKSDALYMTWSLGSGGIPVQKLVICPVWALNPKKLGLKTQGVTLLPAFDNGGNMLYTKSNDLVYDVFDWVGSSYYPYKLTMYKEICWGGLSRRIPKNTDFSKIFRGYSKHYLIHSRGVIMNGIQQVREAVNDLEHPNCLRGWHDIPFEFSFTDTCSAMWWHEVFAKDCIQDDDGRWLAQHPSFDYEVYPTEEHLTWGPGAFMALPIGAFVATTQKSSNQLSKDMEIALQALQNQGLDTQVVNLGSTDDEDLEAEGDENA